jgi:transcriptional regulator with XRE-family HTH domain
MSVHKRPRTEDSPMTTELRRPNLRGLRSALGFSRESIARVLDVSTRTVERWEGGANTENAHALLRLDELGEIVRLGQEIYGDDLARFMATPRQSLGNRTPAAMLVRGDLDDVLDMLSQAYEGQWG